MRTQRDHSPLSVPAMAIGFAVATLLTGIVAGGWMWGMMGGIGMMPGYGFGHMPYGYMGYGMGLAFVVSLFIMGGIFGALAAWFYNIALGSGSTEDRNQLAASK